MYLGTWVWDKGETVSFTKWKSGEPINDDNKDCIKVSSSNHQWEVKNCDDDNRGVLCMKGTSTAPTPAPTPAPAPAPSGPAGVSNFQDYKRFDNSDCEIDDSNSNSAKSSQDGCCTWCQSNAAGTNYISLDPGSKCRCVNTNHGSCDEINDLNYDGDYGTAKCNPGKKRKRSLDNLIEKPYATILNYNQNRWRRQAVDTLTQRSMKCEPLWGGQGGYWSYDYEVPKYCFSKLIYNSQNL